jgi:hypothetical protein
MKTPSSVAIIQMIVFWPELVSWLTPIPRAFIVKLFPSGNQLGLVAIALLLGPGPDLTVDAHRRQLSARLSGDAVGRRRAAGWHEWSQLKSLD